MPGPETALPLAQQRRPMRVATVQWALGQSSELPALLDALEHTVATLAGYGVDLAVFPEFFHVNLLKGARFAQGPAQMRKLAEYTEPLLAAFSRLAQRYRVNLCPGSLPLEEGGRMLNMSWLCHRDGSRDRQPKLHITPNEREAWCLEGGNSLQVFDSDVGRVGILVCYDVEFPELPRLLREQGLEILLVPFWTDTRHGYLRVRLCAQARAVENECYVAIAGGVGLLRGVDNVDTQYSQSAIFSPADLSFPPDAVLAQADANIESFAIADLDLARLAQLRQQGAVRNGQDRRHDLYQLHWTVTR
ncbi:carbon-nitrogen hydrolase family protein [Pseudomonas sp. zfem005]|uniref:carbon-nitrogen hydrolase family protein n=1 Tax=Pseudomonas sp. zfem005 TaxID=3078200 RepID=UPI002929100F|nr:carbon-nitrogen hydrolase family protein [Pseudomonas sp. zfem005]MDU9413846.1 carbon-nitrogen hydrolase family protein [Pseudomonas sp. zfem005]